MIKYIGSKRLLVPQILEIATRFDGVHSVCDLFCGTTRVGQAFKRAGYHVHANDNTAYAYTLAQTFVEADANTYPLDILAGAIERLNALPPVPGYVTRKFAQEAQFFREDNAAKIDAIRHAICAEAPTLRPALLTALMLAADKVDSTVGVQMAFLKHYADRAHGPMALKVPELLPGPGFATRADALALAAEVDADLAYVDPPYNQHSYLGNYHIWESLVLGDEPETYGRANKRIDCRSRVSPFNLKAQARDALDHVIGNLKCRYLILSFNNEGHISRDQIEAILGRWGSFECLELPFRRHIGSKIGIYNDKGVVVGKAGPAKNSEFLFFARRK